MKAGTLLLFRDLATFPKLGLLRLRGLWVGMRSKTE